MRTDIAYSMAIFTFLSDSLLTSKSCEGSRNHTLKGKRNNNVEKSPFFFPWITIGITRNSPEQEKYSILKYGYHYGYHAEKMKLEDLPI